MGRKYTNEVIAKGIENIIGNGATIKETAKALGMSRQHMARMLKKHYPIVVEIRTTTLKSKV